MPAPPPPAPTSSARRCPPPSSHPRQAHPPAPPVRLAARARLARLAPLAIAAATLPALACASSSPRGDDQSPEPPTGTGPLEHAPVATPATPSPPGTATVASLVLPNSVPCPTGSTVKVTASYTTSGAGRVVFLVDGQQAPGEAPTSGSFDLALPCDGSVHNVVAVALDADNRATVQSRAVLAGG